MAYEHFVQFINWGSVTLWNRLVEGAQVDVPEGSRRRTKHSMDSERGGPNIRAVMKEDSDDGD